MLTRLHALTPTHVHATCFPSPCCFQHKCQEGNGDNFIYSGFFGVFFINTYIELKTCSLLMGRVWLTFKLD